MKKPDSFRDFVLDQLRELPGRVEARAMFGGHGLYRDGVIFGIVWKGKLYLKIPPRPGWKAFKPLPGKKSMRYYAIPADLLENPAELAKVLTFEPGSNVNTSAIPSGRAET